jgi:putative addiction module component (TIGR02574 family)
LAQDLLDSVASETFAGPVTDEQRSELRARLAHHRAHPEEADVTLAEIKAKLRLG